MPITLLLQIGYKVVLPLMILIGLAVVSYHKGAVSVQTKWDLRESELTTASVEALYQGKQRELAVTEELTLVRHNISETSNENNAIIKKLVTNNRKLMADRMQPNNQTDCSSGRVSENTSSSKGSNGTRFTTGWWLPATSGEDIVTDYELADRLNESLRACRTYVTKLQEIFK